jgi:hypothetical protein
MNKKYLWLLEACILVGDGTEKRKLSKWPAMELWKEPQGPGNTDNYNLAVGWGKGVRELPPIGGGMWVFLKDELDLNKWCEGRFE